VVFFAVERLLERETAFFFLLALAGMLVT
jgi:hypothetical protein